MFHKGGVHILDESVNHIVVILALAGDLHGIGDVHGIERLDTDDRLRIGKNTGILPDGPLEGLSDIFILHSGGNIKALFHHQSLFGAVIRDAAGSQDSDRV